MSRPAALNYMPQRSAIPSTIELVRKIAEITPGTLNRTFPVSSGAEANETAIKVARAYHRRNGEPGRYKIISRFGSYHGDLGLVQWFGSTPDHRTTDYEPAYPGMLYAPQPNVYRCGAGDLPPSECAVRCAKAVEELIKFHQPSTVAALIAEPVTNDGVVPGPDYWPMIREICNEYGGRADRRRGDDGSWPNGQDVRRRQLGRRAGHHDDGGRTGRRIHAGRGNDGHHRDCRPLRGDRLVLQARLHLRGTSGRGRRSAQEHRDHRGGGAGRERRRVRRVPHGVALDAHGRPSHRRRRSRAGTALRHRACERPNHEGRVRS